MEEHKAPAAIERDPERLGDAWVFHGTRVPVAALFENLRDGATVDDFLEWFPGVTRDQVAAVLDQASRGPTAADRIGPTPAQQQPPRSRRRRTVP